MIIRPTDELARRALATPDLTSPQHGPHALQQLVTDAHAALAVRWNCRRQLERGAPVIAAANDPWGMADRVTRRLGPDLLLRAHMRGHLPNLLAAQALDPPDDLLLVCPGVIYRHSPISPLQSSEPHQLDLWHLRRGGADSRRLAELVQTVLGAVLPGQRYRLLPSARPHLTHAMRLDIDSGHGWIGIGRAGLVAPSLLEAAGLDQRTISCVGLTLGLDRVLMLRKGIDHIQRLRSRIPDIAAQMRDLTPYRPPAHVPAQRRELPAPAGLSAEEVADRIRLVLPHRLDALEAVELLESRLRLTLRHPCSALSSAEADTIRDEIAGVLGQRSATAPAAYVYG
jgi:phenylalanyl-tRNA synthetase alpha chain